jgi:hypothetical protein
MTRIRTKIGVAAVTILGFAVSAVLTFLILHARTSHAAVPSRSEAPFTFSRSISGGLAGFTSNVPAIALRSDSPGAVSNTKTYNPFTMEIYEPGTNGPASFANGPTEAMRAGVRLHGMVSRLFPKLSYRLKLRDENGASRRRSLLGMPADADWVLQGPWLDKSLIRNDPVFAKGMARRWSELRKGVLRDEQIDAPHRHLRHAAAFGRCRS